MPETIPPHEFLGIFKRIAGIVDFGGSKSREESQRRLKNVLKSMKERRNDAETEIEARRWRGIYHKTRVIYRKNFVERFHEEAEARPNSLYGLTFRFGLDRAQEILRERAKARIRDSMRWKR